MTLFSMKDLIPKKCDWFVMFDDEMMNDENDKVVIEMDIDACPTRAESNNENSETKSSKPDTVHESDSEEEKVKKQKKKKKKNIWKESNKAASKNEIKALVAEMLGILTGVIMNNHVYTFGGRIYLHERKGSMGDRAIGVIADIIMIWWSKQLRLKFEELNIVYEILKIYVDDVNGLYKPIENGVDFVDGKLTYDDEKAKEDENVPDDVKTMLVIKKIANSIDSMIQMTTEVPSDHPDKKVPMLDMKVWVDDESSDIFYEFYEKPTKNRYLISKDSAMPMRKKIDSLSQGVFRRLHNTKHELSWNVKVVILEKYMTELKASGYSERDRYEILRSGIYRYENLRKMEDEGKRPFFGNRLFNRNERDTIKARKKTNWFQNRDNNFASVFFVPPTPNSVLLKMLVKCEEQNMIGKESRIKFVETCGRKYGDYLKSSNPFLEKCKPEDKCLVCSTSAQKSDCKVTNIGYSLECKLCRDRKSRAIYWGESSRSGHLRGLEHFRALENKSSKSVMFRHIMAEHGEEQEKVNFEMRIASTFKDSLNRQIFESRQIRNTPLNELLNSKSEFYGPCIKRKVYVE